MILKTYRSKKTKKTLICINTACRTVFTHVGCTCRSKCPKCGAKGSALSIENGKVIF